jgi:hypothetical protein
MSEFERIVLSTFAVLLLAAGVLSAIVRNPTPALGAAIAFVFAGGLLLLFRWMERRYGP